MFTVPAAADQLDVFSYRQARAAGWTLDGLKHAVATRRLARLRRGVYTSSRRTEPGARAAQDAFAVAVTARATAVSHQSAAHRWGLPAVGPVTPSVTVTAKTGRGYPGVQVHRSTLWQSHVTRAGAVLVTSPARTIVDLARSQSIEAAVAAGDSALHSHRVTLADIEAVGARCAGWPGARRVAAALALFDPRMESVLESLSRLRFLASSLPPAQPQVRIFDASGRFVARVDFLFDGRVVGEADGLAKTDSIEKLHQQAIRHVRLENAGYRVVRWLWRDLDDFEPVIDRVEHALRQPPLR